MPLYDFDCDACGETFEAFASPGGAAPCAACGASEVRRRWSAPMPPSRIGLKGEAARRSDATRAAREERRHEGFAADRERRKQEG